MFWKGCGARTRAAALYRHRRASPPRKAPAQACLQREMCIRDRGRLMRKTELLIPAGSLDVLKTAVIYGADAVYLGGEAFGLRAKAKNFTNEEIREGIAFAHERGVKVYITANIFAHNDDLPGVEEYFKELGEIGPDALIISDPVSYTHLDVYKRQGMS